MKKNIMLKNRYHLQKKVGWGGFATTFLAVDEETKQLCVIKEFSLRRADDWKAIELFEREAKTLKHLKHPNIPKYRDYFTIEEQHNMHYCLVQEYIAGKTLAEWMADGRHFTEQEVVNIALLIVKTLKYLQQFSPPIIHRDIKPQNILLSGDDLVYLIDFGAVRDRLNVGGGSTVVGTFGYMPPEQTQGKTVPASDIYSLGVTLIHLLSHIPPSEMEDKDMRLQFHPHVNISREFTKILERMTEPHLKKRYQNASEVLTCLQDMITQKRTVITSFRVNIRYLAVGAALVLLLGGFISFFTFLQQNGSRSSSKRPSYEKLVKPPQKPTQPSLVINGGFESSVTPTLGFPNNYGYWGGDNTDIVSSSQGITPIEDSQMLRFNYAGSSASSTLGSSDVCQLIDINMFSSDIATGESTASLSAHFNRVMGNSETDTKFAVGIFAHTGSLGSYLTQIENKTYLAGRREYFFTDGDVNTWELASIDLHLPMNTEFLSIHIAAWENIFNDGVGQVEFDGHYADAVLLNINTPIPEP